MNKSVLFVVSITFSVLLCFLGLVIPVLSSSFKQAMPGYRYEFPKDHGSHEAMKTEWWYYTGHLQDAEGKTFGYELTFFRIGNEREQLPTDSAWALKNVYMTHFALSDENTQTFYHFERINRGALGLAGAEAETLHAWNKDWSVVLNTQNQHTLQAEQGPIRIVLSLEADRQPVIHGINGVSQKADCTGCASHYYSYTRMPTSGQIRVNNKTYTVTGNSWMDHEFGSNQLTKKQIGWDWFSVQLDNNTELMLYALRLKDGQLDPNSSGTIISHDTGEQTHLRQNDFEIRTLGYWTSPKTGGRYPSSWEVRIPRKNIKLRVTPTFKHQELVFGEGRPAYWEGSANVSGEFEKVSVSGRAYVELTGYAKPFEQRL
jgi:predicted secreted hydrolase